MSVTTYVHVSGVLVLMRGSVSRSTDKSPDDRVRTLAHRHDRAHRGDALNPRHSIRHQPTRTPSARMVAMSACEVRPAEGTLVVMTDVQWLFETASVQFRDVVASLRQADWTLPTNCEVSVRELVEHVVAGNEFAVRLLSGAADARSGIDGIRLGPDPVGQLERSCHAQTEAFARASRARPLRHPSGDVDFETFVRFRLGDLTIHAWDVAVAADLDTTLEPALVAALWTLVEPHLEAMQAMGAYGAGASGRLAPDTDAQCRLLDAFGRAHS